MPSEYVLEWVLITSITQKMKDKCIRCLYLLLKNCILKLVRMIWSTGFPVEGKKVLPEL